MAVAAAVAGVVVEAAGARAAAEAAITPCDELWRGWWRDGWLWPSLCRLYGEHLLGSQPASPRHPATPQDLLPPPPPPAPPDRYLWQTLIVVPAQEIHAAATTAVHVGEVAVDAAVYVGEAAAGAAKQAAHLVAAASSEGGDGSKA